MENKLARFCLSCGIPMHKNPQNGGSENNGCKSVLYCSYCYQNCAFTFKGTVIDFRHFSELKCAHMETQQFYLGYLHGVCADCNAGNHEL